MPMGLFFFIMIILLALGTPIAVTFGLMAFFPRLWDPRFAFDAAAVVRSMINGLDSFTLLAVPLYMLAGMIMAKGGLSARLFNFFAYFVGTRTAGFPIAAVITTMFYAAISGSSPATVSAVGSMTIPFLVGLGYEKKFSAAIVTVAGGLGVILPPSISYIVIASATGTSPSRLFIAGIIPGVMIGFSLMLYCYIYCRRKGEDKARLLENYLEIRKKGFWKLFRGSILALLAPVIILGSIYGGIASPTEAAVIAVVYGLVLCLFVYRSIPFKDIGKLFVEGAKTYVNVLFIIAAAMAFARTLTILRYPQSISAAVLGTTTDAIMILLFLNLIMILCGLILENIPNIMILSPIMFPIAMAIGIDPVHFGVIMTINFSLGMITPPLGINLFVGSSLSQVPVLELSRATVPIMIAFFVCLMLVTFIPALSLFLPSLSF